MPNHPLIQLTLDLCHLDATTGKEKDTIDYLDKYLTEKQWKTQQQHVENDRNNLWAFSDLPPKILLTTHIDTVPDYIPPTISTDGKQLLGRGVCDAKGVAACMILAAEQLRQQKIPVALLFVVGEEVNSIGARTAAQFGVKVDYVINGEPTELKLIKAMKGTVVFELKAQGIAAHSAYPHLGHSALHQLIGDVHKLIEFDWPSSPDLGATTCNIGLLNGGKAHNVLADEAWAKGIIRATVPSQKIIELMKNHINEKTTLNIISHAGPQYLKTVNGFDTGIVSFGSDIPYLRAIGEPLLFGPGSILDAHTTHEKIDIDDLHSAVESYIALGKALVCQ